MWKSLLYTLGVLILALGAVAAAGWYNIRHDPEGRLNLERLTYAPDVISKRSLVRIVPHDTLLIGSSRMMEVDPDAVQGRRAYNAAMGGASPERIRDFLTAFAEPRATVVIAFDFFMMNEANTPIEPNYFVDTSRDSALIGRLGEEVATTAFRRQVLAERSYVLNIGTLARALAGQTPGAARTDTGGNDPVTYVDGQVFNEGKLAYNQFCLTGDPNHCSDRYTELFSAAANGHFGRYVYSEQRVAILREIRALLDARNIRYVIIIGPEHSGFAPVLARPDLAESFARFRQDVSASFEHVCDYADGSMSDPSLYYTWDPFHYLPDTGARMVNDCLARNGISQ